MRISSREGISTKPPGLVHHHRIGLNLLPMHIQHMNENVIGQKQFNQQKMVKTFAADALIDWSPAASDYVLDSIFTKPRNDRLQL
jgi:hypothetical protein